MKGSEPILTVKNNTTQVVPVTLFDLASITSGINSPVTYQWDVTEELYNNKDSVSIQVRGLGQSTFETYSFSGEQITNAAQVVSILNTFNVGAFYLEEVEGQFLIKVNNSNLQYLQLDIYRQNNQLPVFANFNTTNSNIRMNNATTIEVVLYASDPDGDPITYTVDNLPAFGVLNQFSYAGITYAVITLTATGVGDNGNYNFTVYASDGYGTTGLLLSLLVDGSAYPRFIRPYISSRNAVSGNDEIWTYSTISSAITGITSFVRPGSLPWPIGFGANFVRVFAEPIDSEEGSYIIGAFIRNGVGYANDSFVIQVSVSLPA